MQLLIGFPRNIRSKNLALLLAEKTSEYPNNALWDNLLVSCVMFEIHMSGN